MVSFGYFIYFINLRDSWILLFNNSGYSRSGKKETSTAVLRVADLEDACSSSFSLLCVKHLLPLVIISVVAENLLYHDVASSVSYMAVFNFFLNESFLTEFFYSKDVKHVSWCNLRWTSLSSTYFLHIWTEITRRRKAKKIT